jgi:DNA-binding winged helix-turn-helix (wHTH) protein
VNEHAGELWRIGDWQVAPDLGEISRSGQTRKLDPRAMRLLMFLAERPGQVAGITELLDGVWGKAVVTPNSVYEAVAALRQALGDSSDKPVYIATLPRRGYRLVAAVERVPPAEGGERPPRRRSGPVRPLRPIQSSPPAQSNGSALMVPSVTGLLPWP